jgi:SWI/SNF-related matrix-associated actin-dependent regulator of chromatin subfamily A-like protein 1
MIAPTLTRYCEMDSNTSGVFRGLANLCLEPPIARTEEPLRENSADPKGISRSSNIPCPESLSYLPYQTEGIAYALDRPAVLIADEMGLGKTVQAIGIANAIEKIERVLIVCPASLKLNWLRELDRWLVKPIGFEIADGKRWPHSAGVIANYEILHRYPRVAAKEWDLVIFDEAHYCKNPRAKRTKVAFGIPAQRKVLLTGTPITNRPAELFPLLNYLDPVRWNNFFQFARRYADARRTRFGWDFSGASHLEELHRILRGSVMIRRLKADVLSELPPKRRQIIVLPADQAKAAVESEREFLSREAAILESINLPEIIAASNQFNDSQVSRNAISALAELSRLRHQTAVAKAPCIAENVLAAAEQGPVVVFGHHKDVLKEIYRRLEKEGIRTAVVTGSMSVADRQASVDAFQGERVDVILGTIGAMGVGHTLTRSCHVIFAELDWVPANMSQAEDRCHRIGQPNPVLIQHFVLDGSLDAQMAEVLIRKQSVIDQALDSGGGGRNPFSAYRPLRFRESSHNKRYEQITPKS